MNSDIEKLKNIIYEEGNFHEWRDKYSGYIYRIIRPVSEGWLCGYVSVPEGHNYSGMSYDDVDVQVHGGLTFGSNNFPDRDDNEKGYYWFGFDCGHAGDLMPYLWEDGTYRTKEYVKNECKELAKQLKDMEGC